MERAEKLKGVEKKKPPVSSPSKAPSSGAAARAIPPLGFDLLNLRDDPGPEGQSGTGPSKGGLSEEEKKVLTVTSKINGREYVPFLSVDLRWEIEF